MINNKNVIEVKVARWLKFNSVKNTVLCALKSLCGFPA